MDRLRHFHLIRLIRLSAVTLCSPFELTIPSNDDENVMCTSMWSFAHMTSSETIFGIPFGRSDWPHSSLPADTKLNCGREEDNREREEVRFDALIKWIYDPIWNHFAMMMRWFQWARVVASLSEASRVSFHNFSFHQHCSWSSWKCLSLIVCLKFCLFTEWELNRLKRVCCPMMDGEHVEKWEMWI